MNTKLVIWIVGILLGAVIAGVVWYLFFIPKTVLPQSSGTTTTLPISGSVTPVSSASGTPSGVTPTFPLTTQTGDVVSALDFIHNGVTIPDEANVGRYLLAGNLGYCLSDPQKCQAAPAVHFTVYYNSGPKSFLIDLTEEPIGQARLDMEQFMLKTLGLTQAQLCSLNYLVGVSIYVNSQFTGKNLGFSFCPGATVLPK
ncbi:hypothetical protein A3A36_02270 [Candidatus Kaiserbacteria bacterium RIFCSPLOWO2_01_FULL_52_12b]|uniref:Uncharacterized protein n=1 Tax=Candidatus Kaiserbacteria bacterium RIFCSPLOWO2_01_FULL_52_12b TaxID=1798509 RepID=A0A1F6EWG9_9BACT|nr:MAG: hypothetical protein A3A36_02270 [Candidatus Kaiserbacteria bacterium RIFCSPLOWO2_01_FULL_52_12b]